MRTGIVKSFSNQHTKQIDFRKGLESRMNTAAAPPAADTTGRRTRRIIRVSRNRLQPAILVQPSGSTTPGTTATINILPYNANYRTPIVDLQPQPLPQQTMVQTENLDPFRLEEEFSPSPIRVPVDARAEGLECNICYNVLQKPVGCGTPACSARFCTSCLAQAMRPANAAADQQQRCPVCRSTPLTPTLDTALDQTLQLGILVACPHCYDTKVPYPKIEQHKAKVCPGVHVACRLAFYGCTWTGPRGDNHKETCPLEPFAETFLERFRKEHMNQQQQNHQLFAQVADLRNQLNTRLREPQQNAGARVKDPRNPVDVLAFFMATMLRRREGSIQSNLSDEESMWNSATARATVLQTMVMVPTAFVCFLVLRSSVASLAGLSWSEPKL